MFVAAVSSVMRKSAFGSVEGAPERILEQDRMPRIELRGEQPERRDHRQVDAVLHRDKMVVAAFVEQRDCGVIARINLGDLRLFINDLRLVIAHLRDLVRDHVELLLADQHPHQLVAAEFHAIALDRVRLARFA